MHKPEAILKQIVNQHGSTILAQSRLKGLILDMMPTAEKKNINVMKRAIDEQIGVRLLEMQHDDLWDNIITSLKRLYTCFLQNSYSVTI